MRGTANVVQFACTGKIKPIHYIRYTIARIIRTQKGGVKNAEKTGVSMNNMYQKNKEIFNRDF